MTSHQAIVVVLLVMSAWLRAPSAQPAADEEARSRAERLAELRDIERTIARFEEAVGPDQPAYVALGGLHALRAIMQEMAGRPEAAMASARHALELVDDDPALASTCIDAGTILSRVAQARGEGSVAIAAADRAVACALGPGVALSEWAREVSDPVDELLDARQRRSQALWAAGQMARANAEDARIIEIAAAHAPTSADLTERRCARARSVAQAGGAQRSDPIDCHRRTGLHNPPDVRLSAWIALSDIASLRGRPKRAAEALDTALELAMTTPGLDPATLPPLLGKASGRAVERGELERAASLLDDAAAVAGALAELDPVEQSRLPGLQAHLCEVESRTLPAMSAYDQGSYDSHPQGHPAPADEDAAPAGPHRRGLAAPGAGGLLRLPRHTDEREAALELPYGGDPSLATRASALQPAASDDVGAHEHARQPMDPVCSRPASMARAAF